MIDRLRTIASHELRLYRSEALTVALYLVMPLFVIAFVQEPFGLYLRLVGGRDDANGAELAVPGQATMFGYMALSTFGYFYLGEHGWNTWNRLRAMGISTAELLAAKLSIAYAHQLVQFSITMVAGVVIFDLRVAGSWSALLLVEMASAAAIVAYGALASAVASSQAQFNAFTYLGALVMAGLGGALTPFGTLPSWAQSVSPAVPTYWAIQGFERITLGGDGVSDVLRPIAMLVVFAVLFAASAALLHRPDRRKATFA